VDAAARANVERLEGVIAGARSSMAKEQVKIEMKYVNQRYKGRAGGSS
jgi:hypothetical protein